MDAKAILLKLFEEIGKEIDSLSENDAQKILDGKFSLSLKVTKAKSQPSRGSELSDENKEEILLDLQKAQARDDGVQVLEDSLNNRKELESFARFLDVSVLKQDKVDQIREKIVEATVGAKLRSDAIQGKRT